MLGIDVMKQHLGQQEVRDNAALRMFFRAHSVNGDMNYDPAQTPWCAIMMNCCERSVGNPGNGHVNARSFLTYGNPIDVDDAQHGDIIIFKFPSDAPGQGHVTYLDAVNDDGTVSCLGGNQSDQVKYSNYEQHYIVGVRRF